MAFGHCRYGNARAYHQLLRCAAAKAGHGMAAFLGHHGCHGTRRHARCAHGFLCPRQALLDCFQQFLQGNRFLQEVHGTDTRRLDRRIDGGVARHHDHRHGQQAVALPFLEQGHAVRVGHPDIEQYQIRRAGGTRFTRLLRIFGQLDSMSFVAQNFREQLTDTHFIIHYEYVCHSCLAFLISPAVAHKMHTTDSYDFISVLNTKPDPHARKSWAGVSGANFNSKMTTEAPLPSTRFSISMRPPCSSIIFFTIARPNPVPRAFDVT